MFKLDGNDLLNHTTLVEGAYLKGLGAPLLYEKFSGRTLKLAESEKEFVPYEVRLPKSMDALKFKDYEPGRIIKVDKPFVSPDGHALWSRSSIEEIKLLGFGYKNGDSRYPSSFSFNDTDIHMMLAGVTGHGKSVSLNSVLMEIMTHYAPWEVRLIMSDAKVVEFKRYAEGWVPPHITSIAATRDSDYIISVLDDTYNQMQEFNAVLAASGFTNIKTFREETGLTIPRTVLVIDEFQTMKQEAQKKAKFIENRFDLFGRLGRNTGYHMILCSQEPGDTPAATMKNIKIRASLGADDQVSTKILGNDEAKINFGKKGRLIVNTNALAGNKKDNVHFRVPFMSTPVFKNYKKILSDLGDEVGFRQPLSFYDGDTYMDEQRFQEFLKTKTITPYSLVVGEPSFVLKDEKAEGVLRINFDGSDIENTLIYCPTQSSVSRYGKMLVHNMKIVGDKAKHVIISSDKALTESIGFEGLGLKVDVRSFDSEELSVYLSIIKTKMLMIDIDSLTFSGAASPTEGSDDFFNEAFNDVPELKTEINRKRVMAFLSLVDSTQYESMNFGRANSEEGRKKRIKFLRDNFGNYVQLGCASQQLTKDKFAPVFYWMVGMDKMLGLGRAAKMGNKNFMKTLFQDCHLTNTRFICLITDPAEMTDFKSSCFRYYIMDNLDSVKVGKVGVPDYPDTVGGLLGVFYDSNSESKEAVKFKKMAFMGEVLSN